MTRTDFVDSGPLEGGPVRLEPLGLQHVGGLWRAADGDRSTFALTDVPRSRTQTEEYVRRAVAARESRAGVPYAVVDRTTGAVVGTSRFCHLEFWRWPDDLRPRPAGQPDAAQIGCTWLAPHVQRTGVNRWSKRLMLALAFDTWKLARVTLRTDSRNVRSREAIVGIGATFEGVLRAAQVGYDGQVRHSASYSILAEDWPRVRAELDRRLARRPGQDGGGPGP